jgi:CubicO group peptidase (beta-lactamase class C family)
VVLTTLCLLGCGGAEPSPAPHPSLRLDVAEREGLDPARLRRADTQFTATPGLLSVLAMRHGRLVFERYYRGANAAGKHDVFSVTKSVVSALVGIELARGDLRSVDQKIVEFFPHQLVRDADTRIGSITLRDLLTMTSGYRPPPATASDDWVRTLLSRPLVTAPGAAFSYDDGSAHLVSAIITSASGMPAEQLARRELFAPLGIHGGRWLSDGHGNTIGSTGLSLRPRDLLKLGELYLRQGRWEGRQVVPAAWVRESTRTRVVIPGGYAYGYFWWVNTGPHGGFLAQGHAGQVVAVHPRLDLVVVITGSGGFDHLAVLGQVLRAVVP